MTKNKILFVVAGYGYHPIEYIIPKKMLEKNGFIVEVASNKTGLAVAMDSSTSFINVLIKNIDVELYKGIFLIGGSGTMQHLDSKEMHLVLQKAFKIGSYLGAICIAVRILAKAGILNGKKATGWDGDGLLKEIFVQNGVIQSRADIAVDGSIITAKGPFAAKDFGKEILRNLLL